MKKYYFLVAVFFTLFVANTAGAYSIVMEEIVGRDATAFIEITGDGTNEVIFNVTLGPGTIADIRGVFFHFKNPPLDISIAGADVTDWLWKDNSVRNLGRGANMRGTRRVFDFGVEIGTPGIGRDDISATTFTISSSSSIDLGDSFGLRLTSVGKRCKRNGSSKLVNTGVLPAPAPSPVPEPTTILLLGTGLIGLAITGRKIIQSR